MQQEELSYYGRYRSTGRRFEIIGAAVMAAAVGLGLATGHQEDTIVWAAAMIGFMLLIFGASSLRPNNCIKAFAQQLSLSRDKGFAQGLLEALNSRGKTGLNKRSLSALEEAIAAYAASEDADEALVAGLREAVEKRVRKVVF